MPISRRLPFLACLFSLAVLPGCVGGPDRPPRRAQAARGGFSVLVDGPDRPAAPRVIADIGAFAQERGFARQPAEPGPPLDPITRDPIPKPAERFGREGIELEISFQPADHRVSAYLHGGGRRGGGGTVANFYRDFDRAYGPRYGNPDPISEIGFADNPGGPSVQDRPAGASVPNPGGGPGGGGGGGGGFR